MKRYLLLFSMIVGFMIFAEPALAVELTDPLGGADIPTIIGRVIRVALGLSGTLALLMFIYGGFTWMTSGGAKDKIEKGRNTLLWAVIGLAVIFFAYVAVELVITALSGSSS
ncbi:MAG: hypothetical protein ABIG32_02930 [Candidatus Uhrbacteria bacterium]|nr:pilin [Patescibacteria group bacterium]MBU1907437.1 pilin [Patescibacteria group bacterium]